MNLFGKDCIVLIKISKDVNQFMVGSDIAGEKRQGLYFSSYDRARLTYRCTMHTAHIGSKVGGSASNKLVDPVA